MKPTSCAALLFLCLLGVRPAAAQESAEAVTYDLTLQQALELARTRSPSVLAAQARVAEAEGRLTEAELWHNNPTFELGGGPRIGPDDTTVDVDIGIGQEFELGGGRDARRDEAAADIDRAVALAEDASRRALGQVASAFLSVRYAQEHLAITVESERLATELLRAAQLRHEAGDVGVLDVNLATLSLARLQADIRTAEAARIRAEGALKLLLGLEPEASLVTSGDLLNRQRYQVDELLELASNRSDLEAIDAVERQADASLRLAEAQGWPDLGIHLGYGHEEDSNILVGAISFSMPFFDHGQGQEAIARAQANTAHTQREAIQRAVFSSVRTAHETYQRLLDAVVQFERDGLPLVEESDTLAHRSYEAGAVQLGEVLAIRRELIDARVAHLDLLLNAALAGIELELEAGVLE